MLDRLLDLLDVDWSRRFVRWRGLLLIAAMLAFPATTLGLLSSWKAHELNGIVRQIEQFPTSSPSPSRSPHRHAHLR
jgi:hypothetical protein